MIRKREEKHRYEEGEGKGERAGMEQVLRRRHEKRESLKTE